MRWYRRTTIRGGRRVRCSHSYTVTTHPPHPAGVGREAGHTGTPPPSWMGWVGPALGAGDKAGHSGRRPSSAGARGAPVRTPQGVYPAPAYRTGPLSVRPIRCESQP